MATKDADLMNTVAARLQDAFHYALYACDLHTFAGFESGLVTVARPEYGSVLRTRIRYFTRAQCILLECGGMTKMRKAPTNAKECTQMAPTLVRVIALFARDLDICAQSGRTKEARVKEASHWISHPTEHKAILDRASDKVIEATWSAN